MTKPNKDQLMAEMRTNVAVLLAEIETVFRRYSLPLSKVTLIARDPANDEMRVTLTNEDESGLAKVAELVVMKGVES
jgi:hypothetical protein